MRVLNFERESLSYYVAQYITLNLAIARLTMYILILYLLKHIIETETRKMFVQWSRKQSRLGGATNTGCGRGFDY